MDVKTIQKYSKKSVAQLILLASKHFNAFIRERDKNGDYFTCIACGSIKKIRGNDYQASHFHSAGNYPQLRFNEDNVHGGCKKCNYFLSGNLLEYRKNLIKKIGEDKVTLIDFKASVKGIYKWDRFFLIETIETYKNKHNNIK